MPSNRTSRKTIRSFTRPLSHWDKIRPAWQHVICLSFLFILPLFHYGDVIIGDKRFFSPDIIQWRASAESVIEHREQFGEEPLWAENMFSGMPAFIVSYVRSVPHFDNIFKWMAPVFPAAALWVMLVGIYLFLLRLKLHPLAAVTGAVILGLTTYMPIIVGAGHNAKVYALAFIPWMFYGYMLLTRSRHWILGLAVFALAANLEFRAGHPQVTYFFLYLFFIWWVYDTVNAWRSGTLPDWMRKTGLIAAAGLLALAANVQPYWSIYEYSPYSIRGGSGAEERSGLDLDYAMAWSHGWFELTTLAVPGIMGGSSADGLYWGPKIMTSGPHYLGALSVLLILLALFKVKSGLKWVFLSGAVLSALFALGEHFLAFNQLFFEYMPLFNKFRAPEKWLMVTTFSLGMLAAMGANWLFSIERRNEITRLKDMLWPALGAAGLGLILFFAASNMLSYTKTGERQQIAAQLARANQVDISDPRVNEAAGRFLAEFRLERENLAKSDTTRYLLFTSAGLVLIGAFVTAKLPAYAVILLFIALLTADLSSVGKRYIPQTSKVDQFVSQRDFLERQRLPHHTFIQQQQRERPYPYRVFPIDENPFNNAVPAYFYPSVGGYTGAKMNRYQDAIDQAFFASPGLNFGLLDMLNVRYITAARDLQFPDFPLVFEDETGVVMENRGVLPKVFFPGNVKAAESPSAALNFISEPFFSPEIRSVIEKPEETLRTHRADPRARFSVSRYNAREIAFTVNKTEPGYIAISEMYYPAGWRAYVNGEENDIYAMNFLLRSLYLTAGEHEVQLIFEPRSHTLGSVLSWIFNLVILGLLGFGIFQVMRPVPLPEVQGGRPVPEQMPPRP
ncbi:MAG: hypothetical protein LAT75_10285 [Candidatus Cyclonatronum sp.]|uniref:hypothetical protein n=1 Tax=Cyclonatronum sp. TaxID=3024185 RepID=UPI0025C14CDE|nr:hypothetical protein [Cyclonatronum sp.]MCC5934628.1 hypothetical protein [Balneolales bacterium]MCH8487248.1 hypothetical protein [Cyclonatronum sp.]